MDGDGAFIFHMPCAFFVTRPFTLTMIFDLVTLTFDLLFENYTMVPLVFVLPPPPLLRLCITLIAVAEGWLLLDIGLFVLFF